jgi:hypothetical protein
VPMVSFSVLDLDRLMASVAAVVAANAYTPIRERIGMATRRRILRRIDRLRKRIAGASEWEVTSELCFVGGLRSEGL